MVIDWNAYTPVSALIGGAVIGAAAAALLVLNGRIAGVSGILGGLLRPARGDVAWRAAFVAGLVAAGLLVGFGTRYGSGCTSGHGVCGISRLSPRSIVATLVFMAAGFATVYVARHLLMGL